MMRRNRTLLGAQGIVFLLASVTLAGCVGSPGEPAAGGPDEGPVVADFDETTGAIKGRVQNDELMPIAAAVVGLTAPIEKQTTTNAKGDFAISRLEPGTYTIVVIALGYDSAGKKVDVRAGEVAEVPFTLTAKAIDGPFHWTDEKAASLTGVMWKLTPTCIYEPLTTINPLLKTCGGLRTACSPSANCEVHYDAWLNKNGAFATLIAETSWQPQTGVTGRGFNFDVNAPNITRGTSGSINQADPKTWSKDSATSPIKFRIENPETLDARGIAASDRCCDWFYRLFPAACDLGFCSDGLGPDYGVSNANTAMVRMTFFIRAPAPEGWTALPDE
jgi:hypothetical protein